MIENILELLKVAKGETENIRIAQGKYCLPDTFKQGISQVKKETRWQKR
jgi:hypothetical protein